MNERAHNTDGRDTYVSNTHTHIHSIQLFKRQNIVKGKNRNKPNHTTNSFGLCSYTVLNDRHKRNVKENTLKFYCTFRSMNIYFLKIET